MTSEIVQLIFIIVFIICFIFLIRYILLLKKVNDDLIKKVDSNLSTFQSEITNDLNTAHNRNMIELKEMQYNLNLRLEKNFNGVKEKMLVVSEGQKNIDNLIDSFEGFQRIFINQKNRGTVGEVELYSILEAIYSNSGYYRQYKLSNGFIVDAAVTINDRNLIALDSKFPLENYQKYLDSEDDKYLKLFEKNLIKHINDIKNKYLSAQETSDVALMFIPNESIYNYIISNFDKIVTYSYNVKVFIVSPATLIAYLTSIKNLYQHFKKQENIDTILKDLNFLQREFRRFDDRVDLISKDLAKVNKDYQDLEITAKKITKAFNEILEDKRGI